MLGKRTREKRPQSPSKRRRTADGDRLSALSDEIILRIFSHLPIHDLATCHRVSRKLQGIAGDSQLWRAAYYDRFVRPRYNKLPRSQRISPPSKLAKWLDEGSLLERGRATNWKRQYKLRHKWSSGSCDVSEIPVAARPPIPPLLGRLHDGIVYTVDGHGGMRAWSYKGSRELLAQGPLRGCEAAQDDIKPTSFALDTTAQTDIQSLVIGFEDGSFCTHSYDIRHQHFEHQYTHPPSSNRMLTALAFSSPYILTMSETQHLSLYRVSLSTVGANSGAGFEPPRLLTSLKSHTTWNPLSLSLRVRPNRIVAAVAYSMPTFNAGWTAGVQELHLSPGGDIVDSRIASAAGFGFSTTNDSSIATRVSSKPTSLSYCHPYLLVSHADNTLTLYMVMSAAGDLKVGPGKRLWGHTSSVFGAHVGGRGKAVSVSSRGNEIRVWELEGTSLNRPELEGAGDVSVQVTPERWRSRKEVPLVSEALAARGPSPCTSDERLVPNLDITRGWFGFDEESVVVLREYERGRQALTVYDFS